MQYTKHETGESLALIFPFMKSLRLQTLILSTFTYALTEDRTKLTASKMKKLDIAL
jgi:hypothetical protein